MSRFTTAIPPTIRGNTKLDTLGVREIRLDQVYGNYTSWKTSVRVATTSNINLSTINSGPIDTITLNFGDRILVKNQTTQSENGIYIYSETGSWYRSSDLETGSQAACIFVPVSEGSANANTVYICTATPGSDIVGTDSLAFDLIASTGSGAPGSDGSIIYNDGGAFNGTDTLLFNGTDTITIGAALGNGIIKGVDGLANPDVGSNIQLLGGDGNGAGDGGNVTLQAGSTGAFTGAGGSIQISSGTSAGGNTGAVNLISPNAAANGDAGDISFLTGDGSGNGSGGNLNITTGDGGATGGNAGTIDIITGAGAVGTAANGGSVTVTAGNATSGDGGSISISCGQGAGGGDGGSITLNTQTGTPNGTVNVTTGGITSIFENGGLTLSKDTPTAIANYAAGVTSNAKQGVITVTDASLLSNSFTSLVVNNTLVTATSLILVNVQSWAGTGSPVVEVVSSTASTNFTIRVTNTSSTSMGATVLNISYLIL